MVHTGPSHKASNCRWCGHSVDEFLDEDTGLRRYLEPEPLPITADLMAPEYRHRVYQYMGPRLGWAPKFAPAGRNWRELRELHECPGMPASRKTSASQDVADRAREKERS